MKFIIRLLLIILPVTLMGCSYISKSSFVQNRDKGYLKAQSIPPLKIPPGISSDKFHNLYPVSDKQYSERYEDVSIAPPGLNN